MTRAESRLEQDLRQMLVERCNTGATDVRAVADGLGVSPAAVQELLQKPHWDLKLSLRILDALGMGLRVVLA